MLKQNKVKVNKVKLNKVKVISKRFRVLKKFEFIRKGFV